MLISYSIAGISNATYFPQQNVFSRILLNGTSQGGSNTAGEDIDDVYGIVSTWNMSFQKSVTVTPGTSYTLTLQWRRDAANGGAPLICDPITYPDANHYTITAIEY